MAFNQIAPFTTPLLLLKPTETKSGGVRVNTYDQSSGELFYARFRSFGGTERDVNGVYTVEDTAVIDTWFRPDITAACRIINPMTGVTYEIIGTPENIEMRNQFLRFKIRNIRGGA